VLYLLASIAALLCDQPVYWVLFTLLCLLLGMFVGYLVGMDWLFELCRGVMSGPLSFLAAATGALMNDLETKNMRTVAAQWPLAVSLWFGGALFGVAAAICWRSRES
jgi:hypothetical protein